MPGKYYQFGLFSLLDSITFMFLFIIFDMKSLQTPFDLGFIMWKSSIIMIRFFNQFPKKYYNAGSLPFSCYLMMYFWISWSYLLAIVFPENKKTPQSQNYRSTSTFPTYYKKEVFPAYFYPTIQIQAAYPLWFLLLRQLISLFNYFHLRTMQLPYLTASVKLWLP